jgi:hypothetical protein
MVRSRPCSIQCAARSATAAIVSDHRPPDASAIARMEPSMLSNMRRLCRWLQAKSSASSSKYKLPSAASLPMPRKGKQCTILAGRHHRSRSEGTNGPAAHRPGKALRQPHCPRATLPGRATRGGSLQVLRGVRTQLRAGVHCRAASPTMAARTSARRPSHRPYAKGSGVSPRRCTMRCYRARTSSVSAVSSA